MRSFESVGSPPRARGKVNNAPRARRPPRITPACAGKSPGVVLAVGLLEDHPRVRGEKLNAWDLVRMHKGSPPRARGKVFDGLAIAALVGITPACAGKSTPYHNDGLCATDHPRVRGEKHRLHVRLHPLWGITPACAGKSYSARCSRSGCRDHPRVRGEKCSRINSLREDMGSPPRARGKAGSAPAGRIAAGDHPRVRGEKSITPISAPTGAGSPPRARGKVEVDELLRVHTGITPACAGKRSYIDWAKLDCEDHPRVRGEKSNRACAVTG